ncbi:MAG: hypothetical protein ACP5SI_06815 [Chloroflexia bacterium]
MVESAWLPRIAPMAVALIGAVALFVVFLLAPRRTGALIGAIGAALLFLTGVCEAWLTTVWVQWMLRSALPPRRTMLLQRNGSFLLSLLEAAALVLLIVAVIVEGRRTTGEGR